MTPMVTDDYFRDLERTRTQSLVTQNMALATKLHAPEYQLVTPGGRTFSRDGYLGEIAAGTLRYVKWEIGAMQVRTSPAMAIIRYQARLEFPSGNVVTCWHTDSYELQDGVWLAVWSQATALPAASNG